MADRVSVIIDLGTPSASLGKRLISSRFLPMLLVICFGIPVTKFSMTIFPLMLSHLPSKLKKVALEHLSAWRSKTSSPAAHRWKPQSPSSQCVQDKLCHCYLGRFFHASSVCCDSSGQIIQAQSYLRPPCDPNTGEPLAALLAFLMAASPNLLVFHLGR